MCFPVSKLCQLINSWYTCCSVSIFARYSCWELFYCVGHMTLYICRCLWGYQWPSVWWCRHDGFQEITCLMVCSWCVSGDPWFDGVVRVGLKRSRVWWCGPGGFQEILYLMVLSWWVLIKDSMTFYWLASLFMSSTIIYLTWFHWFIFRGWCL